MKIVINKKNLIPDDSWQEMRKVRAVIENEEGCFAISHEAGKYIFPGGTCDKEEDNINAIQREILEETGIIIPKEGFKQILEIETMYDDAVDYRTKMVRPRHTITTYYYVKTNKSINEDNINLTDDEKDANFKISFVERKELLKLLLEEHKEALNWQIFYDENKIVVENIIKNN